MLKSGTLAVAGLAAMACTPAQSSGSASAGKLSAPTAVAAPSIVTTPQQALQPLTPVLATSELVIGRNRFALGLIGDDSRPILNADIQLDFFELNGEVGTKRDEATATFRWVELQSKGIYTAPVTFDHAGRWGVEVRATREGRPLSARMSFDVRETGQAPSIGVAAPAVRTLTPSDVRDTTELCTAAPPCDLHAQSLDAALGSGAPMAVLFAAPGFCTSAVCAPQHGVFLEARKRHPNRANYLHVEIYKDPRSGTVSDAVTAWNLPSEPWVYFLDKQGIVVERFEGIATLDELEQALTALV